MFDFEYRHRKGLNRSKKIFYSRPSPDRTLFVLLIELQVKNWHSGIYLESKHSSNRYLWVPGKFGQHNELQDKWTYSETLFLEMKRKKQETKKGRQKQGEKERKEGRIKDRNKTIKSLGWLRQSYNSPPTSLYSPLYSSNWNVKERRRLMEILWA